MSPAHAVDDYLDLLLAGDRASPSGVDQAPRAPVPAPVVPPSTPARAPAADDGPAAAPRAPRPVGSPVGPPAAAPPSPHPPAQPRARVPAPLPAAAPVQAPAAHAPAPTDEAPAGRRATDRKARWLRLRCGRQLYALELLSIREVVLPSPLLPLRGAAPAVVGVMNLRGQVVPVIDLGLQLGEGVVEDGPGARIVVLDDNGEVLGLRVSTVEDVVLVEDGQIEDARSSRLAPVGDQRIRGIARLTGTVVLLLDAGRLLRMPLHSAAA